MVTGLDMVVTEATDVVSASRRYQGAVGTGMICRLRRLMRVNTESDSKSHHLAELGSGFVDTEQRTNMIIYTTCPY
jgi:hypothetical protein